MINAWDEKIYLSKDLEEKVVFKITRERERERERERDR